MEALLKSLQCNKDIVRLDLSNNLIDDQGVINVCQTVASLPQLKSLNLSGNLLTLDGVMKMENLFSVSRMHLIELSELNLSFNKITDQGVQCVSKMCSTLPKLTKLSLKSCHLSSMENFTGAALGQLVSLDVSHNNFKNLRALWAYLSVDKIRELNLDLSVGSNYSQFPKELIDFLKSAQSSGTVLSLENLSLANCSFSDSLVWELVQALRPASQLKQLSLMNNSSLSSLSLKTILKSNLPLEGVNLRGCHQIASDFKGADLSDFTTDVTNLPQKLVVSISSEEDKSSLAASFKDLWISQFGGEHVKVEQSEHTLSITYSPE